MSNCTKTNVRNQRLTIAQTASVFSAMFPAIAQKRRTRLVVTSLLLVLLSCIGNISIAQPTCTTTAPSWTNAPFTATFNYTGSLQSWTVPAGVTNVTVDARGAQGGGSNGLDAIGFQSLGGNGGRVEITGSGMNVTPGHSMSIVVGGQGATDGTNGTGGFGGGGNDYSFSSFYPGAGGGGYSSITDVTSSELLVVAGGGGGGGGYTTGNDLGGDGGGITAADGTSNICGTGGGGGSAVAGGSGNSCAGSGTDGDYLAGGDYNGFQGSGGGGGGFYGGGSGEYGGGGGGGSSYTNSIYAIGTVNHTIGYNTSGNGMVMISYALPLPTYGINTFSVTAATGSNLNDAGIVAGASSTTGYLDHTGLTPIIVYPGGSYASSITWGVADAHQEVQVWIDFNDNGTFETSEEVTGVLGYSTSSTASPLNFNIDIPLGAALGTHFMRIRGIQELASAGYGLSSHLDPCLSQFGGSGPQYNSGDAVDYMITVAPAPGCSGTPVAGTANIAPGTGNASTGFSLSLSGSSVASGLTYQWQSSADGISGWSNISGATDASYGFTGITSNTFYRCVVTCTASSSSDNSAVIEAYYTSCGASISSWVNGVLTTSFAYTGAPQTWTVPAGTTSIDVDMQGGKGGHDFDAGGTYGFSSGGKGGRLQATLPVSGGQTLNIYVGGAGADGVAGSAGGYNGGAPGQTGFGQYHGGGGGGATDIRIGGTTLADRKLVAGGGGGGGINYAAPESEKGGDGGGLAAQNGFAHGGNTSGLGGYGGTQSCCAGPGDGSGGAGAIGIGGTGFSGNGVGGGGGGYYGGGSGGSSSWSGGGGGSSYTDPSATSITHTLGTNSGDGIVSINYIPGTEQPVYGINTFSVTAAIGANLADNNMVIAADATTGYVDRISLSPITLYKGGSYASRLTWGSATSYQEAQVWIDFNDNGTFESSEEVTGVVGYNASSTPSPLNFTISIPSGAAVGTHLMRIRGILEAPGGYALSSHLDPCLSQYGGSGPQYNDGDIADYRVTIVPPPTVTATPASLNFGSIISSTTSSTMSVSLDAFALTPTSGSLSINAPANYNISFDGSTWTSSLTLPYTGGAFSSVPLYVQFVAPALSGIYSGSITVTGGSLLSTVNVPVTGISASPCSGTPTAGTAAVTPSNGSGATPFTLSLSGYTLGVGITYDWQSSADGVSGWASISGATNNSYSFTGITANTYYRCILTCTAAGAPATSTTAEAVFLTCASTAASWANGAVSTTYSYTGSLQSWTVPAGVTSVTVDVQGAKGGGTDGFDTYQSHGGNGGRVEVTGSGMTVTPGHVLSIVVGGQGDNTGGGGFGGGGTDYSFSSFWPGAGGGGYSSITDVTSSELLVVAGGGGGGGGNSPASDAGGNGGGTTAANGVSSSCGTGGHGGSPFAGGTGESCFGDVGTDGDFLTGGDAFTNVGSGAGGGGYYGGGTGSQGGGGGGGSSFTEPLYAIGTVTHTQGYNATGNGLVIINYTPSTEIPAYGVNSFSVTAATGSNLSDAGMAAAADPVTGYIDRLSMTPINLYNGASYASSITWGIAADHQEAQVWIDFNDNGTFETSEEVTGVLGYSATSTPNPTNFYITVPSGAPTGNHLMRVRGISELASAGYSLSTHLDPCQSQYGGSGPQYNDGDVADYMVNIMPIPACSGTPTAGTAAVSPTTGNPSTPFTLTLSGYAVAAGITFQWQSSPDGSTWSDISGATNFTYSFTGISVDEHYQCIVTCTTSASSATSTSTIATFVPPLPTCVTTAASWNSESSFETYYGATAFSITGYAGSNLNDASIHSEVDGTTGYGAVWGSYSPVTLLQDHSYSGSVTWGIASPQQYAQVWIDFNDDGTFSPSEEVTPVSGYGGGSSAALTLTIPTSAQTGIHLMRMRAIWEQNSTDIGSAPPHVDPCLINYGGINPRYWSGTVTDYYANIMTPPAVASATPNPISFPPTTPATFSAAIPTTLTGSYLVPSVGAFTVNAPANFQVSNDGSSWGSGYTIPYTGGTVPATSVYIRFNPAAATAYTGSVTVTGGGLAATYNIVVDGLGAAACTGTPTAGIATVSPTSGAAATPFTLTVSGYTVAGGVGFQWQSSTDGTTWSDIAGATLATYSFTGISQNEYYQCIVTCSNSGLSSTTASVLATFLPVPSCVTTGASWNSESGSAIYGASAFAVTGYSGSNLSDASIQSEIDGSTGYGAEYGTYSPVTLLQNHSYSGSVTWGIPASHQFAQVWIDFNNDGTFDPSEEVTPVTGYSGGTSNPTAMTITIPAAATLGVHLMRMRAIWEQNSTDIGGAPAHTDPCLVNYAGANPRYWSGTATDYYVNIMTPPPSASVTPTSLDFGNVLVSTTSAPLTASVSAAYLLPSAGTFTVAAATADYLVSPDGSSWSSSYTVSYSGGTLPPSTVYVEFLAPSVVGTYAGTVTLTGGGLSSPLSLPVTGNAADLCTGTPTAGTAVASPSAGTSATSFSLSLTGTTIATGLTYQWQSSPDGSTWSDVTGATDATYTFSGLSTSTYYQCIVTCTPSGLSSTSSSAYLAIYCIPTYSSGCSAYSMYTGITSLIGELSTSIADASTCSPSTSSNYYDEYGFTNVILQQGNTYSASIAGGAYYYYMAGEVWIDFNDNGTFDPSESVGGGYFSSPVSTMSLVIPLSATPGAHRMRVLTNYFGSYPGMDPCAVGYYYGDAKDYKVTIAPPPPVVAAVPNPITFPPTVPGASASTVTVLTGTYLTPSAGTFTVTAPAFFQVSSDGVSWATSYTIPYTGSTLPATNVYVQFNPASVTSYGGNVTVVGGEPSTYNIVVSGVGAPSCTGTPTAGTATITPTSGGGATLFTASLSGYTVAGGMTFQWQSSTDGSTWSNISGATLSSYSFTGLSHDEYFQCVVTCSFSGLSATSTSTLATFLPTPTCTPTSTSWTSEGGFSNYYGAYEFTVLGYSGSTLDDYSIQSEIDNSTGYGAEYGTYAPVDMQQNSSNYGYLYWYFTNSYQYTQVWVDFNNDGTFDPTEEVTPVSGYSTSSTSYPTNLTLTIPVGAAPGIHLMRVRALWEDIGTDVGGVAPAHVDPCLNGFGGSNPLYWSGTATDYYTNILCNTSAITGTLSACLSGGTTTLSNPETGGLWTTDNAAVATVGTDGTVTGGIAGTANITYTIASTGCSTSSVVTINPAAVAITGAGTVCGGSTLTLGEASPGGIWTSSSPAIATVGSTTGVVTGVANGTVNISYVGCGTPVSAVVTVNAPVVSGTPNICISTTITLNGTPAGGTWQSLTPSVATIDLTTGELTSATTTGTTSIIYTVGGCTNVTAPWTETVSNVSPTGILGTPVVCVGTSVILSDAVTGGGWSSDNTAVATTGTDGSITGVSTGTANITYSTGCGSDVYIIATVNPSPNPITGIAAACVGQTTQLAETSGGVTWSSDASGIASVDGSGLVTGVSAGVAVISATFTSTGCAATLSVAVGTVYPSAITITPSASGMVCVGGSTPFTASATYTSTLIDQDFNASSLTGAVGGTWSVINTGDPSIYNWDFVAPYDWFDVTIAGDGTEYMGTNADEAGSTVTLTTSLESPSFSTVGLTSATLTYNYYCYSSSSYDYNAEVDYSTDGGFTWTLLYDYYNTITGSTTWSAGTPDRTIVLPPAMIGQPDVRFRFFYNTTYGYYWAVDNVKLTGTSTPSYVWSGIGGATGLSCTSCATTTITPTSMGANVYSVSAVAGGCYTTAGVTVTVNTITVAPSNDGPACVGGTINLSSNVSGTATPATYSWSGPGGFSATTANPVLSSVTTAMAGTYRLTVTANGSGCVATDSTLVTVNTLAIAPSNDGPACVGGTINLSANASGTETITSYSWSGPSLSSSSINPTLSSVTTGDAGTYTLTVSGTGSGCSATSTTNVAVNTIAVAPSNDGPVCVGGSIDLFANASGTETITTYSWSGPGFTSSSVNPVLSVTSATVAGTYSLTVSGAGSGCSATGTTDVTVNTLGLVAGNDGPACVGGTVNLTATPVGTLTPTYSWSGPGGVFTSSVQNPVLTTSATTAMSGIYTVTASVPGCSSSATTTVAINTFGITAANTSPACVGGTVDLTATFTGTGTVSGYSWSGPAFSAGTQTVTLTTSATTDLTGTYTVVATGTGSGCSATATTDVTINTIGITAANDGPVCIGGTVNLTSTPSGTATPASYSWSGPLGFGAATQNTSVNGMTPSKAGVYTVTYDGVGSGCSVTATTNVAVQTLAITAANDGPTCIGMTINLTSTPSGSATPTGYAWSGPSGFTATTQNTVLTGVTTAMSGVYTVTVMAGTGCSASTTTSVSILAVPASISGATSVCVGSTITVSDVTTGGVWSSSNTGVATIGTSGSPRVVTGLFAGTTTISYSVGTGCGSALVITVNPTPTITGMTPVCVGSSISLGSDIPGGLWTAQNAKATVGSTSGILTGVAFGSDNITYTLPTGCRAISTATIGAIPSSIGGTAVVCQGATTILNTISSGGVWSSSNTAVATVGSTGGTTILTGISAGTATVSYTILATGCYTTRTVTVNALSPITGNAPVCQGSTITLSDLALGGTWRSTSTAIATVGSVTGVVTGVAGGTTRISYTTFEGCLATVIATVNPTGTILGTAVVCEGATTSLSDAVAGGSWSSSNSNATVGTGAGVVTGVTAGTAVISYTNITTGCYATRVVTINTSPSAILGTPSLCVGLTTSLSDLVAGGSWISGAPSKASIDGSTGLVTGLASGTSRITYKMTTGGCQVTQVVTVNTTPGAITLNTPVCQSATITLHAGTAGGSWSTLDIAVATVGSSTGVVTGVSNGTALISYTMPTGCQVTAVVTVNPITPIIGAAPICAGATISLTDLTPGGTWSSSNIAKATVAADGTVTGIAGGTANISYVMPGTGCRSVVTETINALPAAISGGSVVCSGGSTLNLTDATAGGSWTASGGATVDGSGHVTGITPGTAVISYSISGCGVSKTITVNAAPALISGNVPVCAGSTLSLVETVTGGTWSSSATAVGTVSTSGVVTAIAGGTTNISYTTGAGCSTGVTVTVNTILPINGTKAVCLGSTTNLSDASLGGTWSSIDGTGSVTVGTSGVVTGVAEGTATVIYTTATCSRSTVVTVNPIPSPISGTLSVCVTNTTTLSDAGAGTWTSNNTFVASVGSSSGVVTGNSAGIATISFSGGFGCVTTAVVTVNAGPSPIGGPSSVCTGTTVTLTDFVSGGVWSSTDATISVDGSGNVTGITPGTAVVTYTIGTCFRTRTLTVNLSPGPVLGTPLVCVGGVTFLSDASTPGISWTSGNTSVATISASGAVTGISAGTATVSYMIAPACYAMAVVTVNTAPTAILGNTPICPGYSITLSDAVTGGSWTSSNATVATVDGSGNVMGLASGTATITYAVAGGGCRATTVVTVAAIAPITGLSSVCAGASISLTDATAGGTWSSADATVTVGSTGVVSGVSSGTATITYTFASGGCTALKTITVNASPTAINGVATLCAGSQLMLTDDVTGGTWTSSNTSVAAVVLSTGVTTGVAGGTARITYSIGGCTATTVVTVTNAAPVTGSPSICVGTTDHMHNTGTGGTWSTDNIAVGTINSASGIMTGLSAGTVTVSYTLPSGCVTTMIVTVNPVPDPISGNGVVCVGGTLSLTDGVTGGTWASSTGVAIIDGTSGVVSAIATGTAGITYTAGGCIATTVVTVGATPTAIGGTLTVCEGATTVLYDATSGGVWSSTTANGTVDAVTGLVTGVTAGTTTISYVIAGCGSVSADVTINPAPAAITGSTPVCVGGSVSLVETTTGGAWSTTSTHASVDGSGNVTALSVGTATISYTLGSCSATTVVTVVTMPAPITGGPTVCAGGTITLHNTTPGGLWSSADATVTVGSGTGNVTGVTAGTATVTYTTGTGCTATIVITINTATSPITGYQLVCIGSTTALTDASAGGVWTSSNTSVATVAGDGTVSGLAAGTATISYNNGGCLSTLPVTVNASPAGISGAAAVCVTATISLSDATPGGAWSTGSSNISLDGSGNVTGLVSGVAVVTYTAGTSCFVTKTINVNPAPSAISGTRIVCVGSTTFLTDATSGGVSWTSNNTGVATVTFSGVVTGVTAGTSIITYAITTGCTSTAVVTVSALPTPITGNAPVCAGSTLSLTDAAAGGVWSSNSTSVATVGSDGTVTAVAGGTAVISYANGGCTSTTIVTVSAILPITGTPSACVGFTTTLLDGTAGGHWTSSNTAVATIGSTTGVVTALTPGTTTVVYTIPSGCSRSVVVTISAASSPITGTPVVCLGMTTALTDAAPGGTWISGTPSVATVGSTGIVTTLVAGTTRITYAVGSGCATYVTVTVNPVPSGIGGAASVCIGSSITLSDLVAGGDWTSTSNVSVTTGTTITTVTGLTVGTATVTYTVATTGCYKTKAITVNDVPAPISGALLVCQGSTTHLSDATGGGTSWTSGTTSVATVTASGNVTGVSVGTSNITYTITTGCKATATVTVHTCPAAPGHGGTTVSGTTTIITGSSVSIADESIEGIWSSSNTNVATVDGVGLVTGVAPGSANINHTITYSNGEVSTSVTPVIVNAVPGDVRVVPNPNNGTFTVKGTLGSVQDEEVSLEVTDVLGQVIYSSKVTARGGKINETVTLHNTLANGMYMLNMRSGSEKKVFHFVIEK